MQQSESPTMEHPSIRMHGYIIKFVPRNEVVDIWIGVPEQSGSDSDINHYVRDDNLSLTSMLNDALFDDTQFRNVLKSVPVPPMYNISSSDLRVHGYTINIYLHMINAYDFDGAHVNIIYINYLVDPKYSYEVINITDPQLILTTILLRQPFDKSAFESATKNMTKNTSSYLSPKKVNTQ